VAFPDEEWRAVPGYDGVEASSLGRVRADRRPYRLGTAETFGYVSKADRTGNYFRMLVRIATGPGVRECLKVHRLVCAAFHGKPSGERTLVLHKDDNGLNNSKDNLSWGSQKENLSSPRFKRLVSLAHEARQFAAERNCS
jgi:hypothetical protein